MELDIWKGDWGLPSVDVESLKVSAYIKFLGAPVRFLEKRNPFSLPNGHLPTFRHGKHICHNVEDVVNYLKSQNFDADLHLTNMEKYTSWAYIKYINFKLFPCLQYIWWVDVTNSGQEVKNWYAKTIPFPFNYFYPPKYEQRARDTVDEFYGEDCDIKIVHCDVYQIASQCFSDLSTLLGDNEFFFGNKPSSLDANVFAYLSLILKVPQKNSTLLNTLKTFDNLVQFTTRISQRYFMATHQEFLGKTNRKSDQKDLEAKTANQQTKDKIVAALFAVITMGCFAVSKGLIQINLKDDNRDSSDYNDYFEAEDEDMS